MYTREESETSTLRETAVATSGDARTPIAWQHRDMNFYAPDSNNAGCMSHEPPSIPDDTRGDTGSAEKGARRPRSRSRRHRSRHSHTDGASASTPSEPTELVAPPSYQSATQYMLCVDPATGASVVHPVTPQMAMMSPGHTTGPAPVGFTWSAVNGYQLAYAHPSYPPYQSVAPVSMAPTVYDMHMAAPFHPSALGAIDAKHTEYAHAGALMGPAHQEPLMAPPPPPPSNRSHRPIVLAEDGTAKQLPVREPREPQPPLAQQQLAPPDPAVPGAKYQGVSWRRGLRYVLAASGAMIGLGVVVALVLMFITV